MRAIRKLLSSSTFWAGALGAASVPLSGGRLDWRLVAAAVLAYGLKEAASKLSQKE